MVLVLFAAAPGASRADDGSAPSPLSASLRPAAHLGPEDVVRIQLEALRQNDENDLGIAVAFRFASPSNKQSTGPLPRFVQMIKQGPYRPMLDYRRVFYSPVEIEGDRAAQKVTLISDERVVDYVFVLRRQSRDPCKGCWMTDGVVVLPGLEQPV